ELGLTHPTNIRRAFEEQTPQAAPWDTSEPAPEVVKVPESKKFKTQRDAEKFIKVDQRAESGQEGADTAKRHRAAYAKAHDTTVEALRKESANAAPDAFFRFAPTLQKQIDDFRAGLNASVKQMQAAGIPSEAIRAIYINLANAI
ncbi:MAG: hypothetical protein Q8R98_27280, partial [Rubrivivax sp.]|nr:hypothetical protein [Rubrivivax sp.]